MRQIGGRKESPHQHGAHKPMRVPFGETVLRRASRSPYRFTFANPIPKKNPTDQEWPIASRGKSFEKSGVILLSMSCS